MGKKEERKEEKREEAFSSWGVSERIPTFHALSFLLFCPFLCSDGKRSSQRAFLVPSFTSIQGGREETKEEGRSRAPSPFSPFPPLPPSIHETILCEMNADPSSFFLSSSSQMFAELVRACQPVYELPALGVGYQ